MGAAATHSLRVEIMRHLLILASLAFVTASYAEEGDFDFNGLIAKKALRDYKKALVEDKKATELKRKELDEEAANLAKTTRDAFVENLKKALKQSMQAGNLDEANKIDAAIKLLKKGANPKRLDNQRPKVPSLVGVWKPAPDAKTAFIIRPNGTCYSVGAHMEGTWRPADKKDHRFIIRWGPGWEDHITVSKNGNIFDSITPKNNFRARWTRDTFPLKIK